MIASEITRVPETSGARPGRLAVSGRFRVALVLFGGMVAFQSSPTLDATKIGYLAVVILCLLGSTAAVWSARGSRDLAFGLPWIASSAALVALVAMSFFIARSHGTSGLEWARDVSAYALFAVVPIFAMDGHASVSRALLVGMLVVAGLLGALSVAVEWLGRRDILDLPFARLVFPSGQLPIVLYLFAMATAWTSRRRAVIWVLLAGVILGLFLITGTRSSLLILVGPVAMATLLGRARIGTTLRSIAGHGAVAVALVLMFQFALALPAVLHTPGEPGGSGSAAPTVPSVLGDRFGSLPGVLGNPASDASLKERMAQYKAAWALFASSPIVGVGPGHAINWVDVSGYARTGFTADTPLVLPAKFGLMGILVFAGVALAYGSTLRAALRRNRRSAMTLTLVGYGAWTIVSLPLGFPVEDKGASLVLILLLALTFAESAGHESRPAIAAPMEEGHPSATHSQRASE